MKDSSGTLSFLFVVFLISWLADADEWWSNENTVYYVSCTEPNKPLYDCLNDKRFYGTATYTAIPEAQVVLRKEEETIGARRKGKNCAVIDRNNWSCEIISGKDSFSMADGEYKIYSYPDIPMGINYSPKWGWLASNPLKALKALWWD